MAVVYFTSNASTGAGSLAEAIQNAQPGDVVRPDETVFERGATIEIALASTLNVDKNLTLDASPFRVRVDGGGSVACASVANGCAATFTAFEFVDGATSGNGGGVCAAPGANVKLDRCGVFGCDASGNGGGVYVDDGASLELNDGVIAGCRANVGGGVYLGSTANFTSQGATIVGNVDAASNGGSGGSSDVVAASGFDATTQTPINSIICAAISDNETIYDATTAAENGSVVGVPASALGFVAPPDSAASFESWSRNAWSNLNLRLLDDASPTPSTYRDSGAVDKMLRYDLDGNFRGRETNGAASCSPGAYETLQANLFWIGVEIDPTAPSDLTASDYDASARTLTLSWTPNLDGVTGYDVQTSTDGGKTWSNLADMSADATSRLCGGLSAGRTYGYRIRAYNAAETTAWSTIIFMPSALDEATVEIGTREVASPSMLAPNGWAASRFARSPGDAAPQNGQTLFVDGAAAFIDAAPQNATLNVGGYATVSTGASSTTRFYLTLGVGATFSLSASADLLRFGAFAKLDWTSGDLTVKDDATTSALAIPSGSTLTIDGVKIESDTLNIGNATSVVFLGDEAVLAATQNCSVEASAFTGTGYFATPPGTDLTAATIPETVRACDYGANVSSFNASRTSASSATLSWVKQNPTPSVLLEKANGSNWDVVDNKATGDSFVASVGAAATFRLFDGENFFTSSVSSYGTAYELAEEQTIGYLKTLISVGYLN